MDRRAYLTALGATVAAVSGCSGGGDTDTAGTATGTARRTDGPATATKQGTDEPATATEQTTEQPEPDPSPRVTDAGLLLDQGSFRTFDDIDGVGRAGILVVGMTYELPVGDGSPRGIAEARILDDDDTELDRVTGTAEPVVTDDPDYYPGRAWFAFDTEPWPTGSYTADVRLTSEEYGTTASTALSADIVEPLGPGEVELRLAEFPEEVVAGEEFGWTLGFRNRTARDSSVVSDTVTLDPEDDNPIALRVDHRENVPAGEEILVEETELRVDYPGTYTYRIDGIDAEFTFTIEPAE